jgi:hypothetical protein
LFLSLTLSLCINHNYWKPYVGEYILT